MIVSTLSTVTRDSILTSKLKACDLCVGMFTLLYPSGLSSIYLASLSDPVFQSKRAHSLLYLLVLCVQTLFYLSLTLCSTLISFQVLGHF